MVVLYGQAAIYETSRLHPAYPFMWTLPMRVLDPDLADLRALLSGPDAPTFVVAESRPPNEDRQSGGNLKGFCSRGYTAPSRAAPLSPPASAASA